MGEQAMVAKADAERAAQKRAKSSEKHASPAEEPGEKRQQGHQVIADDQNRGNKQDAAPSHRGRSGQRTAMLAETVSAIATASGGTLGRVTNSASAKLERMSLAYWFASLDGGKQVRLNVPPIRLEYTSPENAAQAGGCGLNR